MCRPVDTRCRTDTRLGAVCCFPRLPPCAPEPSIFPGLSCGVGGLSVAHHRGRCLARTCAPCWSASRLPSSSRLRCRAPHVLRGRARVLRCRAPHGLRGPGPCQALARPLPGPCWGSMACVWAFLGLLAGSGAPSTSCGACGACGAGRAGLLWSYGVIGLGGLAGLCGHLPARPVWHTGGGLCVASWGRAGGFLWRVLLGLFGWLLGQGCLVGLVGQVAGSSGGAGGAGAPLVGRRARAGADCGGRVGEGAREGWSGGRGCSGCPGWSARAGRLGLAGATVGALERGGVVGRAGEMCQSDTSPGCVRVIHRRHAQTTDTRSEPAPNC